MRFAFVGLGFAARELHLPAVRALPDATVAGGTDLSPARRDEWAALGAGSVHESIEDLLATTRPDVVVVGTPPDAHAAACITALEAGAHVICEKPFVETIEQADEVLAVAERAGRSVAINQEFRFMPIFAAVANAIGSADVGRAVFLHCTQFMDLPPWDEAVPWRAAMPERSLFEGGVHLVDLLHMLVGRLPERVVAMTSSGLDPTRRADAVHVVTLDYGAGLLGQITINRLCRAGTRYADLRVDCEHASLRASYGGRALVRIGLKRAERAGVRLDFGLEGLAWSERGLRRRVLARNPRKVNARATQALFAATASAFRDGTEPPVPARVGRDTLRIIDAAYRSARTGEPVLLTS